MLRVARSAAILSIGFCCLCLIGCGGPSNPGSGDAAIRSSTATHSDSSSIDRGLAILRLPVPSDGPKSMDPVQGSTQYDHTCVSQVYETLLQFKYLKRPFESEPLLLSSMPQVSDDGLTYRFKLKSDVYFHDDPCFPGGKGRKLVAEDVVYSFKRLLDEDISQRSAWVIRDKIQGLDEYAAAQNAAERFDYDAPVSGMRVIDDTEFEFVLNESVSSFIWTLSMFQTSVVPREAVEAYGVRFGRHPVGTGPYCMLEEDWRANESMTLTRNPNYHACQYPAERMPGDEALAADAGKKLPLNDGIVYKFFVEHQPMWLQFRSGQLDYSRVPRDNLSEAFNLRTKQLRSDFANDGIRHARIALLDFIFYGFNMEDPLLGGYTEDKRNLRRAIAYAIDWDERNDAIYNNICQVYDGMIPPGLDGYPEQGRVPSAIRGPDLARARELLAKSGYPGGQGLPTIDFYSSLEGPGKEMAELTARQLKKIGITINPRLDVFSTFIESVVNGKAPMFSYSWISDYPDAENNLSLFYSQNRSPGSNRFNYSNPVFDKMYERVRTMSASPERTDLYGQMRDIVLQDMPFVGSLARTRYYVAQPWLKNFKPEEIFANWPKYLAIESNSTRRPL